MPRTPNRYGKYTHRTNRNNLGRNPIARHFVYFGKKIRNRLGRRPPKFHYKINAVLPLANTNQSPISQSVSFYIDYPGWYNYSDTNRPVGTITSIPGNNYPSCVPLLFRMFDQYHVTGCKVTWTPSATTMDAILKTGLFPVGGAGAPAMQATIPGFDNKLYMAFDGDDASTLSETTYSNMLNDPKTKFSNLTKYRTKFISFAKRNKRKWFNTGDNNAGTYQEFQAGLIQGDIPSRASIKTLLSDVPGSFSASSPYVPGEFKISWYVTFKGLNTTMLPNYDPATAKADSELLSNSLEFAGHSGPVAPYFYTFQSNRNNEPVGKVLLLGGTGSTPEGLFSGDQKNTVILPQ